MNSKKLAVLAIFGLLILGAAGFGLYVKKMNTVGFRGIEFSVKGVEQEVVDDWTKAFESVLQRDEILQDIVTKSEYSAKLSVSEEEAVDHLRNAVKVNHSSSRNSLQVGLRGKRKQRGNLDEISQHVFNISAPYVAQIKPAFGEHYRRISQAGQ